jgi:ligand-binding SRPBCC domain-containing protein
MHIFEQETWIDRPLDEVFTFFSKAENLNAITPSFLNFKLLTPTPIVMRTGLNIDYQIKLGVLPFKWKTLISSWEPPNRFVDEQLKGPYRVWHHTHTFEAVGNRTRMVDTVRYLAPGWIFESLVHRWFVRPRVEAIFAFRTQKLKEFFPPRP